MEEKEIQEKLTEIVEKHTDWQRLRQFMLVLKKENPDTVLNALLNIFSSNTNFPLQTAAGILWKLKPKYKRNLHDDIRNSLKGWNVSIEELPWYFAEVTSLESVRNEVKKILDEPLDENEKIRADTYFYWLSGNQEEIRKNLSQSWNGRLRG